MPGEKAKKKSFQATWAAPVILQGGGVQYSTASGATIPPPKPVAPAPPVPNPPPQHPSPAQGKTSSLQWKNPQNGRGWHTGGYDAPPQIGLPAGAAAGKPVVGGLQSPAAPLPSLPPQVSQALPTMPAANHCKWAPAMSCNDGGQQQKAKAAAATAAGTNGAPSVATGGAGGGPTAAEKAAQRRAEQRARKAEERASKRMCGPGGLDNNFLSDLCGGLPFCTGSRDNRQPAKGPARAAPNGPYSFGAERRGEAHSGFPSWNFGGNAFNFNASSWSPPQQATPGGGIFGFGGQPPPPPRPADEAMVDDLIHSEIKHEGERGLWSLVTDLLSGGQSGHTPLSHPTSTADGRMPPLVLSPDALDAVDGATGRLSPLIAPRVQSGMSSGNDSPFDDIVDMDVALGVEGVSKYIEPNPTNGVASPPAASPAIHMMSSADSVLSSSGTVVNGAPHQAASPQQLSEHFAASSLNARMEMPAAASHPYALAHGAPLQNGLSDRSLLSDGAIETHDLIEMYEDAVKNDHNLGGDLGPASGAFEGFDATSCFTLDWKLPSPDGSPTVARRGVPSGEGSNGSGINACGMNEMNGHVIGNVGIGVNV